MLRSMTGFGRCILEDETWSQMWEIRSVNSRFLDIKWRIPFQARALEGTLEKIVKQHAIRGRVEIILNLKPNNNTSEHVCFNEDMASVMLDHLENFSSSRGDTFIPDYTRLLEVSSLWIDSSQDTEEDLSESLTKGLILALEDWNESRLTEGSALKKDFSRRVVCMMEWIDLIQERSPIIKEERFEMVLNRLNELLDRFDQETDKNRFIQEIAIISDRLDVSEELTRLAAHMSRINELLQQGGDVGKKLDFTLQECFREINTCGNKIQDLQVSRLIVDLKSELEKCREQVQNLE